MLTLHFRTGAQLKFEHLEDRATPAASGFVAPNDAVPEVASAPVLLSGLTNGVVQSFISTSDTSVSTSVRALSGNPFLYKGVDVRTAVGDVNGDGTPDYILATGPGVEFEIAVISGADNSVLVPPFDPFPPATGQSPFTGGGFVSSGAILNNGRDQIVVTPDQSGGPRIAIYDLNGAGADGSEVHPVDGLTRINNFLTIDPNFRGGARTAVGDLNGDGAPDLAIAAGPGGGPSVVVIDGNKVPTTTGFTPADDLVSNFYAFNSSLRDGVYLAIGDVLGDGQNDLILGPGAGGPNEVVVLSGQQLVTQGSVAAQASPIAQFSPTGIGPSGEGVRVAVSQNLDGSTFVIVGSGNNLTGAAEVYSATNFVRGSTSEPANGQILTPFIQFPYTALADGVFVG